MHFAKSVKIKSIRNFQAFTRNSSWLSTTRRPNKRIKTLKVPVTIEGRYQAFCFRKTNGAW